MPFAHERNGGQDRGCGLVINALLFGSLLLAQDSSASTVLLTDFKVSGKLVLAGHPSLPKLFPTKLIYVSSIGHKHEIKSLRDLHGRVAIEDDRAALAYVRLRGSQALLGTMEYGLEAEVVPRSQISEHYVFGIKGIDEKLLKLETGMFGVVADKDLAGLNLKAASIKRKESSYVVTRTLLQRDHEKLLLCTIRETVDQKGAYHWRVIAKLPPKPSIWYLALG